MKEKKKDQKIILSRDSNTGFDQELQIELSWDSGQLEIKLPSSTEGGEPSCLTISNSAGGPRLIIEVPGEEVWATNLRVIPEAEMESFRKFFGDTETYYTEYVTAENGGRQLEDDDDDGSTLEGAMEACQQDWDARCIREGCIPTQLKWTLTMVDNLSGSGDDGNTMYYISSDDPMERDPADYDWR